MNKWIGAVIISIVFSTQVSSQEKIKIDSIKTALKSPLPAKTKASLYYKLSELIGFTQIDSSYYYAQKASETVDQELKTNKAPETNELLKIKADAVNNLGVLSEVKGNAADALKYLIESNEVREKLGDEKGLLEGYTNLARMYLDRGDVNKSMDNSHKEIALAQKLKNPEKEAKAYSALAQIHSLQGDDQKAKEYYRLALKIGNRLHSAEIKCIVYNNLGNLYRNIHNDSSLIFFEEGLKNAYQIKNDPALLAHSLGNVGAEYDDAKEYDNALFYLKESISILEKKNFRSNLASPYNNMARIYYNKKDLKRSEEYGIKSLELSKDLNFPEEIANAAEILYKDYKEEGNSKKALEMLEISVAQRKKIFNDRDRKSSMKKQLKYEYEKQQYKDSVVTATEKLTVENKHQAEIHQQKIFTFSGAIGFLLMLCLSIVAYRSFLIKKRSNTTIAEQKRVVENQKSQIEEKQKEIIDSISYAKRLQQAILPPANLFRKNLSDHFILYRPKDIVAGDFYWMETVGDQTIIASADCTGHGVPGALVSIVCSNALNRTVLEFGIIEPGKILDKVRDLVLETFAKSDTTVKDGMDISLVSINKTTGEIKWAGANNPLWFIQNGEMKEIKANKQPIGNVDDPLPFTTHTIQLEKNDSIYLFTDGFADQFGGDKGKKFKYKQLSEKLVEVKDKPMPEQCFALETTFDNWKGSLEQIDDVCIIGIRL